MSGSFQSKLTSLQKRKITLIDQFNVFGQNKGNYTQIRAAEARTLINKLNKQKEAFEALDNSWIEFIQSIADAKDRADDQALYNLYAVNTNDASKEAYMDSVADIDDAVSELETELHLIETNLQVLQAANTGTMNPQVMVINAPLPDIKKRLFKGEYELYKPFIDSFMAEIGNQPNIPDIIKLQKLKERLDGAAFDAVSRFNTDKGYAEALIKLKERFGRDEYAIEIFRDQMYSKVKDKNDLVAVRKAFDELEGCISSLEEFGEKISNVEFQIALERKIPDEIRLRLKAEERNLASGTTPTVDGSRKLLDRILMDYEKIYGERLKTSHGYYQSPRTVTVTVKKPKSGPNLHLLTDYSISSPEEAKSFALENHLCINCFRKSHIKKDCQMKLHCESCNGNHHKLNCRKIPLKDAGIDGSNPEKLEKNDMKKSLLMTAEVTVSNPTNSKQNQKILAFVDPCSDVSLIDKNLCETLKLSSRNEPAEFQTAFNTKFDVVGSVDLNLHLNDGTTVPVNSFKVKKLLENVLVPYNSSEYHDKKKQLPVAYGSPQLLLSMKKFQNLVMNRKVSTLRNGFSTIDSKIGEIICGEGEICLSEKQFKKNTVANIELVSSKSDTILDKNVPNRARVPFQDETVREKFQRYYEIETRRKNGRLRKLQNKHAEEEKAAKAANFLIEPAPNLSNLDVIKKR